MANTFGQLFKVMTWGESHGPAMGVVIDGCPSGVDIHLSDIQDALDRRRPGQSALTSPRREPDRVQILSGVHQNRSTGAPISLIIHNQDAKPHDYDDLKTVYRPGHADFTYHHKYGIPLASGGGRASARETVARVAAGAIALACLQQIFDIDILAYVSAVHHVHMPFGVFEPLSRELIEQTPMRCPDLNVAQKMIDTVKIAQEAGDSVGGVITLQVQPMPIGLGAPVFDRLEADLAKAMLSIPATKGFEIGNGFLAAQQLGSEHNDLFNLDPHKIPHFQTNHAGGTLGGISTGSPLICRIAFKPPSTIAKPQSMSTMSGNTKIVAAQGRHDPCVLPRATAIVEAMAALVLVDHYLLNRCSKI